MYVIFRFLVSRASVDDLGALLQNLSWRFLGLQTQRLGRRWRGRRRG